MSVTTPAPRAAITAGKKRAAVPAEPPTRPRDAKAAKAAKGTRLSKRPAKVGPNPGAQRTALAFNNAHSMARVGDTLLTLYRQDGDVRLVRRAPGAEPEEIPVASGNTSGIAMSAHGRDVLVTFRDFPPRQKPGSFSLDRVLEEMQEGQPR